MGLLLCSTCWMRAVAVLIGLLALQFSAYADTRTEAVAQQQPHADNEDLVDARMLEQWLATAHAELQGADIQQVLALIGRLSEAGIVVLKEDARGMWAQLSVLARKHDIKDWGSLRDELPYILVDNFQPAIWLNGARDYAITQPLETLVLLFVLILFSLYFAFSSDSSSSTSAPKGRRIMPVLNNTRQDQDDEFVGVMASETDDIGQSANLPPSNSPSTYSPPPSSPPSVRPTPAYTPPPSSPPPVSPTPTYSPPPSSPPPVSPTPTYRHLHRQVRHHLYARHPHTPHRQVRHHL